MRVLLISSPLLPYLRQSTQSIAGSARGNTLDHLGIVSVSYSILVSACAIECSRQRHSRQCTQRRKRSGTQICLICTGRLELGAVVLVAINCQLIFYKHFR